MNRKILIASIAIVFLLFNACKKSETSSTGVKITVARKASPLHLSDLVHPTGATELQTQGNCEIRSIQKLVFSENEVYVLDNFTDFQSVFVFDSKNGSFARSIGKQGEAENHYDGLNDISLKNGQVSLLAAGKRAFFNYDKNGNLLQTQASGMIGDEMECTPEGNTIMYNEHSASPASGTNYLIVYDKNYNMIGKYFPYNEVKENLAYDFTGFLTQSDGKLWFSPPFSETVFEVASTGAFTPRYTFDFGNDRIPLDWENLKLHGEDCHNYGFINQWFVKTGRFVQFEYQLKGTICHGIFDESTGQFVEIRDMKPDALSQMVLRGTIVPKDDDEFALILRAAQAKGVYNHKDFDKAALNQQFAGLGDKLESAVQNGNPLLVYFTFKQSAAVAAVN